MTDNNEPGFKASIVNQWGDPESALESSRRELFFNASLAHNGEYYEPSIPFKFLAQLRRINPHHSPLPEWVAGQVVRYYKPSNILTRTDLKRTLVDLETTANGFLRKIYNKAGQVSRLVYQPTINTRLAADGNHYGYIDSTNHTFKKFNEGEVIHLQQHDSLQQIYGVPYWIGALQSILLGENVRIFPRLFFENGGSTGDIVATSGLNTIEQEALEKTLKGIKGNGRFKRVTLQFKSGKISEILNVIPYSTGSDKIDFSKLANLSSDDILDAWGIRKELLGMTPDAYGGSGDLEKIERAWHKSGIIQRQQAIEDAINPALSSSTPVQFYTFKELNEQDGLS